MSEPGKKGEMGRVGLPGNSGKDGSKGEMGPMGYQGPKGERGYPGYNGAKGDDGRIGFDGARGERGAKGDDGLDGITGMKGSAGMKGEIGSIGLPGYGEQGRPGPKGDSGSSILNQCKILNPCSHYCHTTLDSFYCTCPHGYKICPAQNDNLFRKRRQALHCKIDLILVVDSSGSVTSTNFIKELEFVKTLITDFQNEIMSDAMRVGFLTFGSDIQLEFNLNDHVRNPQAMKDDIEDTYYMNSSTYMYQALEFVYSSMFNIRKGDRADANNVLIFLTDGTIFITWLRLINIGEHKENKHTNLEVSDMAANLKNAGVTIVVIGIGSNVQNYNLLDQISSEFNNLYINDFSLLNNIQINVDHEKCTTNSNTGITTTTSYTTLLPTSPPLDNRCPIPQKYCDGKIVCQSCGQVNRGSALTVSNLMCFCELQNGAVFPLNGTQCIDVNECAYKNGGCEHFCYNYAGTYSCGCQSGYELGKNKESCHDINECEQGIRRCSNQFICVNTIGNYKCVDTVEGSITNPSIIDTDEANKHVPSKKMIIITVSLVILNAFIIITVSVIYCIRRNRKLRLSSNDTDHQNQCFDNDSVIYNSSANNTISSIDRNSYVMTSHI
ncbi:Matrilin-3 [Intoshia linei]|uniref:Matrilin-3 n=1 Tax=Intoshia linei TaxID=1819745 RepID=A0A177AZF2_9BILA|nr:Matrilin-3 [Intoshia linei]